MLESRAGIEEWEEEGNKRDVRKRIAVMDKLLAKLRTPQPPKKLPKARIVKPSAQAGRHNYIQIGFREKNYVEVGWFMCFAILFGF